MRTVSEAVAAYGNSPRTVAAAQRVSQRRDCASARPTTAAWSGSIASPNRWVAIPAASASTYATAVPRRGLPSLSLKRRIVDATHASSSIP